MIRVALLGTLLLTACAKPLECTSEVTAGDGTVRASVRAEADEPEATTRRRAMAAACESLCKKASEPTQGCAARCQVDAESGKIGARVRCAK